MISIRAPGPGLDARVPISRIFYSSWFNHNWTASNTFQVTILTAIPDIENELFTLNETGFEDSIPFSFRCRLKLIQSNQISNTFSEFEQTSRWRPLLHFRILASALVDVSGFYPTSATTSTTLPSIHLGKSVPLLANSSGSIPSTQPISSSTGFFFSSLFAWFLPILKLTDHSMIEPRRSRFQISSPPPVCCKILSELLNSKISTLTVLWTANYQFKLSWINHRLIRVYRQFKQTLQQNPNQCELILIYGNNPIDSIPSKWDITLNSIILWNRAAQFSMRWLLLVTINVNGLVFRISELSNHFTISSK